MLSTISSVYDPLGLSSPFFLKGNKLLQSLCNSKLDWDDPVDDEHCVAWQRWRSQLPSLENVKISRCFKPNDFGHLTRASLHYFSDASQSGYGEYSYVRLVDNIRQLRSNNGTNFVGAERELNEVWKNISSKAVNEFLGRQGADHIQWKHNPPTASHVGGVWERQIRSVRAVLSSLLRQRGHLLDDELFRTLMTEVEAVVNGRPLTVDNLSDPLSPCPLTPSQLLTMKSKVVLPPAGVFEKPDLYCRQRWKRVQHIADEFWNRWKKEYLASLQFRHKNVVVTRNFKVGDIVLVKDENSVRNSWPMAKIVSVRMDDKQKCVHSVFVRFGTCNLSEDRCVRERPVNKLILLLAAD